VYDAGCPAAMRSGRERGASEAAAFF